MGGGGTVRGVGGTIGGGGRTKPGPRHPHSGHRDNQTERERLASGKERGRRDESRSTRIVGRPECRWLGKMTPEMGLALPGTPDRVTLTISGALVGRGRLFAGGLSFF